MRREGGRAATSRRDRGVNRRTSMGFRVRMNVAASTAVGARQRRITASILLDSCMYSAFTEGLIELHPARIAPLPLARLDRPNPGAARRGVARSSGAFFGPSPIFLLKSMDRGTEVDRPFPSVENAARGPSSRSQEVVRERRADPLAADARRPSFRRSPVSSNNRSQVAMGGAQGGGCHG